MMKWQITPAKRFFPKGSRTSFGLECYLKASVRIYGWEMKKRGARRMSLVEVIYPELTQGK